MSLPFGDDLGIPDDVDYEGILTNEENPLKQAVVKLAKQIEMNPVK